MAESLVKVQNPNGYWPASLMDADGMLHWVQQVGKSPDPVQENETQLYGVGAFLLAASEMTRWEN